MKNKILASLLLLLPALAVPARATAQNYSFSLPREEVHSYWNNDGSLAIEYTFVFQNDSGADAIDFIDVGVPNENYDLTSVTADVDGRLISDIEPSPYVKPGVALGLGGASIRAGQSGTVRVRIGRVRGVLYPDDEDSSYASAVFSPTWFDASFVHGSTDLTVVYHLPLGVGPDDPRYHRPSSNWPGAEEPETYLDEEGRVAYRWRSPNANGYSQYKFGASFPAAVVPESAIVRQSSFERFFQSIGPYLEALAPCSCIFGVVAFIVGLGILGAWSENQRKKQYLPPKISIEGHGIKRGLTAVEAALLMEQPLDRVLTMILFGLVKKNAVTVTSRDPLELKNTEPKPAGLHPYETDFLGAFESSNKATRPKTLQQVIINLIKSLQEKMKGFSRKETIDYYKSIAEKAWQQVAAAGTPEVKAQAIDENLEWTMLDRDFDGRSREIFSRGPVFVPVWWGRYDPSVGGGAGRGAAAPSFSPTRGGSISLPRLPGADFAASVVGGVQSFSRNVIGDLTGFTGRVTAKTNPLPVSSSSGGGWRSGGGGGGGHSCACACACAGCACACAGGGR
ncbi:MAG: hypothetical protein JW929_15865 [Anaerolineales bacterium]|nr:hypothetical protein [Anaerolineales bacterium]